MADSQLILRQIVVVLSAVVYWAGVIVLARRVRKEIGRSPNVRPKGLKEKVLWMGWFFVIAGWFGQPLLISAYGQLAVFIFWPLLSSKVVMICGILLVILGYAGTLWCYSALGRSWRIGVNRNEKPELIKKGPYRSVRHPIYTFQVVLLAGVACLLPTIFSFMVLLVHFTCIMIKALDEEAYLLDSCGPEYEEYRSRTGRFLPKLNK